MLEVSSSLEERKFQVLNRGEATGQTGTEDDVRVELLGKAEGTGRALSSRLILGMNLKCLVVRVF